MNKPDSEEILNAIVLVSYIGLALAFPFAIPIIVEILNYFVR